MADVFVEIGTKNAPAGRFRPTLHPVDAEGKSISLGSSGYNPDPTLIGNLVKVTAPDATDQASAIALANQNKQAINAIIDALKSHGVGA